MADNKKKKKKMIDLNVNDMGNIKKILEIYGLSTNSSAIRKALGVLAVIAEKEKAGYSVYLCKDREKEKLVII